MLRYSLKVFIAGEQLRFGCNGQRGDQPVYRGRYVGWGKLSVKYRAASAVS
jgi:hypothetical protein